MSSDKKLSKNSQFVQKKPFPIIFHAYVLPSEGKIGLKGTNYKLSRLGEYLRVTRLEVGMTLPLGPRETPILAQAHLLLTQSTEADLRGQSRRRLPGTDRTSRPPLRTPSLRWRDPGAGHGRQAVGRGLPRFQQGTREAPSRDGYPTSPSETSHHLSHHLKDYAAILRG